MARTAPLPNIPAIPGMNPGVWIMGGGGGGGGAGGRGGRGGAGGQGANGQNGGGAASGGGKDAGSCGPGSGGGCMNPVHGGGGGTHAGDPVDPVTGRVYTIPQTDLVLTGPLVFELRRSYSSHANTRDVGLGFGWSHSLAWAIEIRRRTMVLHRPIGVAVVCDLPPVGGEIVLGDNRLRRDEDGFVLADPSGLVYLFEPSGARTRLRLASVVDRAGNRIDLAYRGEALESLLDSAGRTVRVRRHADGQIAAFELVTAQGRPTSYRTYTYDERGDLVAAVDAAGRRVRYAYEDHRLVEQAFASGLSVFYRYDSEGRCTETWCAYPGGQDPALAADVPALLADGHTKAKGVLHCKLEYCPDFTMVFDSRQGRRFDLDASGRIELAAGLWVESLAYDTRGDMVAYEDPLRARTTYERDALGRVIAVTDPTGARTEYTFDERGDLVAAVDELGAASEYRYDESANLLEVRDALGELVRYGYDERGLRTSATTPDGATTRFHHDAEANLVELTEPHQKPRRMQYDDVGRVLAVTDEEGYSTRFDYDLSGTLQAVRLPNGGAFSIDRDADGRVAAYRGPDGGAYTFAWAGYNVVHELRRPTGETTRLRYDRECNLVEVENEHGELHRLERDLAGRVVAERFFNGRQHRYELDLSGRLARIWNDAGETTDFERDPCGRVTRRTYSDDTFDAFEYDPVGRLVRAENESVACTFSYDARGNLVREEQSCAGRTIIVESEYDAAGRRTALWTSVGHNIRIERDTMGRPRRVLLGDGQSIERVFDALGREVVRELSGGARIVCRYDGLGALVERRVLSTHREVPGAPAWVGPLPQGTTYAEGFACSAGGDLVEHVTSAGERTRFTYDLAGRPVARAVSDGRIERFAYEGGGRLHEVGPDARARRYGPGGALLARGSVAYNYDHEARRTTRVDEAAGGRHQYEWGGRGLLAAVELPDGTRVEHTYDTSARRILKRLKRPDGITLETRFVWSGDDLVYEVTEEITAVRRATVQERAYVWDEAHGGPLAHRELRPGDVQQSGWVHYTLGPGQFPSLLLGADGTVLARLQPTVWGALEGPKGAATTPWRYLGQYHDDETGLSYNRYRFYDPEVGLYINADPLGLSGGLNAFEYAYGQPFRVGDPEGLSPVFCTVSGHGLRGGGASGSARRHDPELHPVVADSLPPSIDLDGSPFYPATRRSPEACAEPGALSNYIRAWERKNNKGRPLDPKNPRDRIKIQKCLRSITSIRSEHEDGEARAPCPNCSQLLQNLRDRWGAPKERVIEPGATQEGGSDSVRSTPPDKRWTEEMRKQRRSKRRR